MRAEMKQMVPDTAPRPDAIRRLLTPRTIAFIGGSVAEMALRRCLDAGYEGVVWPVHPGRDEIAGIRCYRSVLDLPAPPDAAFIGVRRDLTIDIVRQLAESGAGGAVCYAAGFAEMGDQGRRYEKQLIEAAGAMPVIGPNCLGFVNYLDRCALWPYLFGGGPVECGAALISQSGNIAMNLSMNQRSVRFTHLIGAGNQAVLGAGDYIDALLGDERVRTIGLYLEGIDNLERFSGAARRALDRNVPLVVMKAGASQAGAQLTASHTSALTSPDAFYDALFERLAIVRAVSLSHFLETLKLFDLSGPPTGRAIVSLSCSGGEAALMGDAAAVHGLETPPFTEAQCAQFQKQSAGFVTLSNPFDYNTAIWGNREEMEDCFTTAMSGGHDAAILIHDHPTCVMEGVEEWVLALDSFIAAHARTGKPAFVLCTLPELLDAEMRARLIAGGVTPLQGFQDGLAAFAGAVRYRELRARVRSAALPRFPVRVVGGDRKTILLDEWASKERLRAFGLASPEGVVRRADEAPACAVQLGFPVVVKPLGLAHKSDFGAVFVNLRSASEVAQAVEKITAIKAAAGRPLLIERMITGVVAEWIVGVHRDEQFGPALVMGSGGVLAELAGDSVTLLLPVNRAEIAAAASRLKVVSLMNGFRNQPASDMERLIDAVQAIAAFAEAHWDRLIELDVNPLLALPAGQNAVAADALIHLVADPPVTGARGVYEGVPHIMDNMALLKEREQ